MLSSPLWFRVWPLEAPWRLCSSPEEGRGSALWFRSMSSLWWEGRGMRGGGGDSKPPCQAMRTCSTHTHTHTHPDGQAGKQCDSTFAGVIISSCNIFRAPLQALIRGSADWMEGSTRQRMRTGCTVHTLWPTVSTGVNIWRECWKRTRNEKVIYLTRPN